MTNTHVPDLTVEELRQHFSYDEETGELHRLSSGRLIPINFRSKPTRIQVAGTEHSVLRIIWALKTGEWPATHASVRPKNGNYRQLHWENLVLKLPKNFQINGGGTIPPYVQCVGFNLYQVEVDWEGGEGGRKVIGVFTSPLRAIRAKKIWLGLEKEGKSYEVIEAYMKLCPGYSSGTLPLASTAGIETGWTSNEQ
jgi:hypothetical protein